MQISETQCFFRDDSEAGVLVQPAFELQQACADDRTNPGSLQQRMRDRRVPAPGREYECLRFG